MITYDHTIMPAASIDDLREHVNMAITTKQAWQDAADSGSLTVENHRHDLVMLYRIIGEFIINHGVEFLDLLERGAADRSRWEYTRNDKGQLIPHIKES